MFNAVGLQGPGVAALARPRPAGPARAPAPPSWRQHLGPHRSTTTPRQPSCSPTRRPASSPSRSTCRARTSRAGAAIFAHDAELSAEVIAATAACGRPRWAKLSPNTDRIVEVAGAVPPPAPRPSRCSTRCSAWSIDPATRCDRRSAPAAAGCPARHPPGRGACRPRRARRASATCRSSASAASRRGWDATELMLAGASAVQVGTATFADRARPLEGRSRRSARAGRRPRTAPAASLHQARSCASATRVPRVADPPEFRAALG